MPTSISLTPHFQNLIQELVAEGQYNNVSEVVRDGLRMIEERRDQRKIKLEALRQAVKAGADALNRGEYEMVRSRDELKAYVESLGQRASQRVAQEAHEGLSKRLQRQAA
jgi:antitoxin ParD1/3/4